MTARSQPSYERKNTKTKSGKVLDNLINVGTLLDITFHPMSKNPSPKRPTALTVAFRHLLHDYMVERNEGRVPYTKATSEVYREKHNDFIEEASLDNHHLLNAVVSSVCRTVYDDIKTESKLEPKEIINRWDFSILLSLNDFYKSVNMTTDKHFLSEKPLPPNNNQDTK